MSHRARFNALGRALPLLLTVIAMGGLMQRVAGVENRPADAEDLERRETLPGSKRCIADACAGGVCGREVGS